MSRTLIFAVLCTELLACRPFRGASGNFDPVVERGDSDDGGDTGSPSGDSVIIAQECPPVDDLPSARGPQDDCPPSGELWHNLGCSEAASWRMMHSDSSSGRGISQSDPIAVRASMVIGADGHPVISWEVARNDETQVHVASYDGTQWRGFAGSNVGGGISEGAHGSDTSFISLDAAGFPMVVWRQTTVPNQESEVYLRRFNGTRWVELAGSTSAGGISKSGAWAVPGGIAMHHGQPVVTWYDDRSGRSAVYVAAYDGSGWRGLAGSLQIGGVSNAPSSAAQPALVVDSQERLLVVWSQEGPVPTDPKQIMLLRYDGTQWSEIAGSNTAGGVSTTTGDADDPQVAIDALDAPVVVWHDQTPGDVIRGKRLVADAWQEFGYSASSSGIGIGNWPALAVSSCGQIWLSWRNTRIYARSFHGGAWDRPYASPHLVPDTGNRATWGAAVAINAANQVFVAWSDNVFEGAEQIYVRTWGPEGWEAIDASLAGAVSNSVEKSTRPSLAFLGGGNDDIAVAWTDIDASDDIGVVVAKRFNGAAWVNLGETSIGADRSDPLVNGRSAALAAGNGKIVVSWLNLVGSTWQGQALVAALDGTTWRGIGGPTDTGGGVSLSGQNQAAGPRVAVDKSGNPTVVWREGAVGNTRIHVQQYDGATWTELSDPGVGIEQPGNVQDAPSVALTSDARPHVAWDMLDAADVRQIFLKYWTGTAWEELAGSSTGGALSDSPGISRRPSVVLDASDHPLVVWHDRSNGPYNIRLKRYDGAGWGEMWGSASLGGISGTSIRSEDASIALTPGGMPVVTWREATNPGSIWLKIFHNGVWTELHGSATGRGISNTGHDVFMPTVAATDTRACVAWSQRIRASSEILLRCADLPP